MDALFIALRAAIFTIGVFILWYLFRGIRHNDEGYRRGILAMFGVLLRRIAAVVVVISLTVGSFAGLGYLALVVIPNLSAKQPKQKVVEVTTSEPSKVQMVAAASAVEPTLAKVEYPIYGVKIPNFQKFEIITRGKEVKPHFFDASGVEIGRSARIVDEEKYIVIWTPDRPDAYAVVYPVVYDSDCQYQIKGSGGKFVACKRDGTQKGTSESWGFRYAYSDRE